MKKNLLLSAWLVCIAMASQAQSKEVPKAPPPPPQPPKVEMKKLTTPPALGPDKEISMDPPAAPFPPDPPPPPVPPKVKMTKFTPPKIVKDEEVNAELPPPPPPAKPKRRA